MHRDKASPYATGPIQAHPAPGADQAHHGGAAGGAAGEITPPSNHLHAGAHMGEGETGVDRNIGEGQAMALMGAVMHEAAALDQRPDDAAEKALVLRAPSVGAGSGTHQGGGSIGGRTPASPPTCRPASGRCA